MPMLSKFITNSRWCGPCKMAAPKVAELSDSKDTLVFKFDVDEAPQLATHFGVSAMPTFFVMNGMDIS